MIPEFNFDGDLPDGIHRVRVLRSLAASSVRGKWLGQLAKAIGKLDRVTAKESRNDVDLLLLVHLDFEVERSASPVARFSSTQALSSRCILVLAGSRWSVRSGPSTDKL